MDVTLSPVLCCGDLDEAVEDKDSEEVDEIVSDTYNDDDRGVEEENDDTCMDCKVMMHNLQSHHLIYKNKHKNVMSCHEMTHRLSSFVTLILPYFLLIIFQHTLANLSTNPIFT